MDPVTLALILGGAIIVIGFLGNCIFERTGFPDMLILITLGMLLGPATGVVDTGSIMGLAPYLAALALVFILFDGGMTMNIYRVFAESPSPRAVVLAVAGFAFSVFAITLILMVAIPGLQLLYYLLFGTMFGGSSSIVVISLTSKINLSEKCATVLSIESTITDVFCIVFSLVVIEVILKGTVDLTAIGQSIAGRFSIGIVLGFIFGLIWLTLLRKVTVASYAYMLTLAVVLLAYAFTEFLGGSGALCSLLFGMMLGNEKEIYRILKMNRTQNIVVDAGLKRFESEIAFLLRTFFFVYIGLIVTIRDITIVMIGIILSIVLLMIRFGAVALATKGSDELENERPIMSIMLTRGLAAAVLATLPMQYADPILYPEAGPIFQVLEPLYINLAVIIILATAIIATVGISLFKQKKRL